MESRDALYSRTHLEDMISQLQHDWEQLQNLAEPIKVLLLDTESAKIYAQSRKGEFDFCYYPVKSSETVSRRRRLQHPLLDFSELFNYDKEILLIRFHPLQDLIDYEELLSMVEKLFK